MFGSHLSVAGGLVNALHDAAALRLDTVQVFTKNQRQWSVPPLDPGAAREWLVELERLGWQGRTVSHDSYLINLASPVDELWERSIGAMREEIERAAALSIPLLVSHPGAHMIKEGPLEPAARVEAGLVRIARAYKGLLRETRGCAVTICLENTAGGGTSLGRTFEELGRLRELILSEAGSDADLPASAAKELGAPVAGGRIGFCMDTCHALAAGYDISAVPHPPAPPSPAPHPPAPPPKTKAAKARTRTMEEGRRLGDQLLAAFDRACGLPHLRVLHLNDSLGALGSRLDRHAHIGKGLVAKGAFASIVNAPALARVPKILETPKEEGPRGVPMDTINLRTLRKLLDQDARDNAGALAGV